MQPITTDLNVLLKQFSHVSRFIVAYSGGLDSTVLLHAMHQIQKELINQSLIALHINHGLLKTADDWQTHCQVFCYERDIDFYTIKVDVDTTINSGIENAARVARYEAFERWLRPGDCLLLAHHQDDQAETLLLRLFRGSGVKGLAAMPAQRQLGNAQLFRPLLNVTKVELYQYAIANQLAWVEDDSNDDLQYDRNYLRHQIIPHIVNRWPRFARNSARAAALCHSTEEVMSEVADHDFANVAVSSSNSLSIGALSRLSLSRQCNVLRYWLASLNLPTPSEKQLSQIIKDVMLAKPDANPKFSWGGQLIRRFRDQLYSMPPQTHSHFHQHYQWNFNDTLMIDGVGSLSSVKVNSGGISNKMAHYNVSIGFLPEYRRARQLNRAEKSPSFKKIFQQHGVPPWMRDYVPLVYFNDELACIGDIWVSSVFQNDTGRAGYALEWRSAILNDLKKPTLN